VRVSYTIDALIHLAGIHTYIEERNPQAAARVAMRIRTAADRLGEFPYSSRTGSAPGTREKVATGLPYVLVYEVHPARDEVIVLGVYHGAQMRPGQEGVQSEDADG
jgi:toxin ParE1/3/4